MEELICTILLVLYNILSMQLNLDEQQQISVISHLKLLVLLKISILSPYLNISFIKKLVDGINCYLFDLVRAIFIIMVISHFDILVA